MIPMQMLDDIMAKRDEQHLSGKLSRVEEAGTEDATSTSTDGRTSTSTYDRTSTSIDGKTSTSTDFMTSMSTDITTSTSTDIATSTSTDITTSTSTDITTSTSTDITTSTSTDIMTSTLIDGTTSESIASIVESPIPPDRSVHLDSYSGILDDHHHIEASQKRLRFRYEVDKGSAEQLSIDTDQIPSIDTNKPASIDTTTSPSIDTTTSSSDKKSRVRSKYFSKPFAKVQALLIAEMIDKGEEYMEEAFTQE
ncbi:hypothetical protein F2Q70_00030054 [Brassica cretica]|uniref:Uncharacterized protein n=2 Tax=Brassica cretica TaxID=69181 RepID=A0A3N6SXL4_BRACR|nr:hypothetical protein F2Q70_00030054 [Brassica cretica]KAF2554071.1 hypothetical protein F2Q68_00034532 [Brassica cretica]KAF3488754.1 hypothetical protein F2Q69_00053320 [Brassica cretica]KAF3592493.1 hypothetical protein DY000_02022362 [Brassica cretica]